MDTRSFVDRATNIRINGNWLYYAALWLYFFSGTLSDSMLTQFPAVARMSHYMSILCIPLFLARLLLLERFRIPAFFSFIVLFTLTAVIYTYSGSRLPMYIILCLYGAENVSSVSIGKIYLSSTGLVVVLSTALSLLGVVQDRLFYPVGRSVRHSLGMNYVTIWAGYVFFLMAALLYIRRDYKWKWYSFVPYVAMSYVVNRFCSARLESLMILVLPILLLIDGKISTNKVYQFLNINSFGLSALITYALQYQYSIDPTRYAELDRIMSFRLRETQRVLDQYAVNLFGQSIRMQGHGTVNFDTGFGYFFVDAFYINFALRYGAVVMLCLIVLFHVVSKRLYKDGYSRENVYILLSCVHGMIISSILTPYFNPLFLIVFAAYSTSEQEADVQAIAQRHGHYDHPYLRGHEKQRRLPVN